MQFNFVKTMKEIQENEDKLKEFLEVLSVSYRYTFNQVLMLYAQGYRGDEDLAGYEFISNRRREYKQYSCLVNGNSVYLYGIKKRFSDLSRIGKQREGREDKKHKLNSYELRQFEEIIQKVRMVEAIEVQDERGLKGYRLEGFKLYMDLGSADKFAENIKNIMRAVLDKRGEGFKSLFMRDLLETLWLKEELKDYEKLKQLSGKDFYGLLGDAFEEYKKLYFSYNQKFFTIDEIGILNMCYECNNSSDILITLRNITGVNNTFLRKIQSLRESEVSRILKAVKEGRLMNYPEFRF